MRGKDEAGVAYKRSHKTASVDTEAEKSYTTIRQIKQGKHLKKRKENKS